MFEGLVCKDLIQVFGMSTILFGIALAFEIYCDKKDKK